MRLKKYQEDALQAFENWWNTLKTAEKDARDYAAFQAQQNPNEPPPVGNYPRDAWGNLSQTVELPRLENTRGEILSPLYVDRTDTRHNPIPHMCLKIPTGGGKTLLGTAAFGRISPPNGLLLWLTPSRAIFRQTWAAFAHRLHPLSSISGTRLWRTGKIAQKRGFFYLTRCANAFMRDANYVAIIGAEK